MDFRDELEILFMRERMRRSWRDQGYNCTTEPEIKKINTLISTESGRMRMARGKGKSTDKNSYGIEFIKASMTADEKKAFLEYRLNTDEIAEFLFNMVDNGYKFSVGYDKNNDSCYATLTNKDGDKAFLNKALTCHARTSRQAIMLIIFKHAVLSDGDWSYWNETIEDDFG